MQCSKKNSNGFNKKMTRNGQESGGTFVKNTQSHELPQK